MKLQSSKSDFFIKHKNVVLSFRITMLWYRVFMKAKRCSGDKVLSVQEWGPNLRS